MSSHDLNNDPGGESHHIPNTMPQHHTSNNLSLHSTTNHTTHTSSHHPSQASQASSSSSTALRLRLDSLHRMGRFGDQQEDLSIDASFPTDTSIPTQSVSDTALLNQHEERIRRIGNRNRHSITTYLNASDPESIHIDPPLTSHGNAPPPSSVQFAQQHTTGIHFVLPISLTSRSRFALETHDERTISTVHSIASDSTLSLDDSDTTSILNTRFTQTQYHNPRYLGSIPYHYPRRTRGSDFVGQVQDATLETPILSNDAMYPSEPTTNTTPSEPYSPQFNQSTLQSCWDLFQPSCEILNPNEHWGDEISIKQEHSVRIFFQNINSCSLSSNNKKWDSILASMKLMECDIINIAQTGINWRKRDIQMRMRDTLAHNMPIHKLNVSQNKHVSDNSFLPGGTAQVIHGDWTGRVVQYIHDPRQMGRWCGVKLRLKCDRFLYLITAYRVCSQQASTIGTETAYNQQNLMLSIEGMICPDPRKIFIEDLTKCVKQWQSEMNSVMVVLDANEHLGETSHGLTKLMRECRLVDLFHQHHGICPEFSTYDRGSRRLDYASGTPDILPFILRCGYLPFYQGVQSDHRGLFIDLSHEIIDGLTRLERAPTRYLHSAYPKDVYRYKQYVRQEFKSHNIFEKSALLLQQAGIHNSNNSEYVSRLNLLDHLITSIQLKGEQKCCNRRSKYDWSDDIHFTTITVKYWNLRRKSAINHINTDIVSKQIYDTLPEEYQQYIDIASDSFLNNWRRSKTKLRNLYVQHRANMNKSQRAQYDIEAAYLGTSSEQIALKHERKKKDKKLYKTLKHHFHSTQHSGITHILIPDKDKNGISTNSVDDAHTWKSETDPTKVLQRILERNITHFGQAEGTPFTTTPLLETFGYNGMSTQGLDLINDGIFPPGIDDISQYSKSVIDRLSDTNRRPSIPADTLTFDNFRRAIVKWREATSTSPSGKHLGHYKSLLVIDDHATTYDINNPDPGPLILEVLFNIAASAFNSGITLERWQHVTTCMIEKVPGVPQINKLRVIHLYEADYNAVNKIVWQRGVVWQAHQQGSLNQAQHGSRPHRTCIEVVISKDQKYMNSSLTRIPMATMDNDAKSCYDRIVASLALLVSNYFQVPSAICATVGATLEAMNFKVRTAMGDSAESYSHQPLTPIHGVGQGGTASPAFWLLVSSILFDCYQKEATGMTMRNPSNTNIVKQWIEAIVDDTSIFSNLDTNRDVAELVRVLEADTRLWEKYLSVSGGCLELSKCFYYILAWVFDSRGNAIPRTVEDIRTIASNITVKELGKESFTTIATKHPSEAHRTLGVWKSMDGNIDDHLKILTQRSKNMANIVATSGIYPYQADVALRIIYTTSMGYSLPAVNISESALDKIQFKALESFIPAMGFNKGFPRAVILGPTMFGGEGVPHLYTESNLAKIEIMIMHIRANTELGQLFLLNLQWVQLHAGTSAQYLSANSTVSYINNWFTGIRQFLHQIQGELYIKEIVVPTLERQGDQIIMDTILSQMRELSYNQLVHVNNWRLFFQTQKLSDLTNAKGNNILPLYMKFPENVHSSNPREDRTSKFDWPYQEQPTSEATFKLWVRCLRSCFLQKQGSGLRTRLQNWTVTPTDSQSYWQAYINSTYTALITRVGTTHRQYSIIVKQTATSTMFSNTFTEILQIPDNYFPVNINQRVDCIVAYHEKIRTKVISHELTEVPTCIQQYITTCSEPWIKLLLQHFRIYDLDKLLTSLSDPDTTIMAVSDGAHKDARGSFGVSVGTTDCDLYQIEGPAPYTEEDTTPFRSEAYGLLANVKFLHLLITTYNISWSSPRKISFYCDNLPLIKRINKLRFQVNSPRMYLFNDSDVITQLVYEIQQLISLRVTVQCLHVKGHQDRTTIYEKLPREAQLNIQAHNHAKNYFQQGRDESYVEFPQNPISFLLQHHIINYAFKFHIRCASRSQELRQYMTKKYNWKQNTPDLIWWLIHGPPIKQLSHPDRRRIRKFIFQWLPTNVRLHSYDNTVSHLCQSCSAIETHHHLLCCPCDLRQTFRDKWFKSFDTFLSNILYTPSIVRRILYNKLKSWCTTTVTPEIDLSLYHPDIQLAYKQQTEIGWPQLLNGRLAIGWKKIITTHLKHNNIDEKAMTAESWGHHIITSVFDLVLQSWELRNSEAHILNSNNESRLTRQRILEQIIALQESSPNVRYCDRDFVYKSVNILEQYSLSNLRSWHKAALSIIKANDNRNRVSSNQQTITQYFQPSQIPVPQIIEPLQPPPVPNIVAPSPLSPAPNIG